MQTCVSIQKTGYLAQQLWRTSMTYLPIRPEPKPRMTQRDKWAKRPAVVRYYAFCDELRDLMGGLPVHETVSLVFTIEMPKSWSEKKKIAMDGKPHQSRPDIDNYVKAFLDALCEDDSYVYAVRAEKYWGRTASIEYGILPVKLGNDTI